MARSALLLVVVALALPSVAAAEIIVPQADVMQDWFDSIDLFGQAQQGYNGWYYGRYTTGGNPATFTTTDMIWLSDVKKWWTNLNFGPHAPEITYEGMHSGWVGQGIGQWAVRRWVAGEDLDELVVQGVVYKGQAETGGDGSTARFYFNGVEIADQAIFRADGDVSAVSFQFTITDVKAGHTLDFTVDPGADVNVDYMVVRATLNGVQGIPEPMTLAMLSLGGIAVLAVRRRR